MTRTALPGPVYSSTTMKGSSRVPEPAADTRRRPPSSSLNSTPWETILSARAAVAMLAVAIGVKASRLNTADALRTFRCLFFIA